MREFGDLCRPFGIALTRKNTIVVAQNGRNCVSILNKEGKRLKSFGTEGCDRDSFFKFPRGVAITKDRHLLITDSHHLTKVSASGKNVHRIGKATPGRDDYDLNCPAGVAVQYDSGNIFVADCENNRLQVYNLDVEYLWSLPAPPPPGPATASASSTICSRGKSSTGSMRGKSKTGSMGRSSKTASMGRSSGKNGGSLGRSRSTMSRSASAPPQHDLVPPLLSNPVALAFDDADSDYVYVVEWLDRVKKISIANEKCVSMFGSPETEKIPLSYPTDIAIDNSHQLMYVTERGNHRVSVFDKDGKFVMCFGKQGDKKGQFQGPYGVAVDHHHVFCTDYYNNRVVMYDSRYL